MCARIKSTVNMNSVKYLIVASLLLSACAHTPQHAAANVPVSVEDAAQATEEQSDAAEPVTDAKSEADLPKQELTDAMLYEYLVAEIGNQRGYKALAVTGSAELAKQTRDPRLAKRAAQLAFESGDMEKAVTGFKLWQE